MDKAPKSYVKQIQRVWDQTCGQILVLILTTLIRGYQLTISPLLGPVCRYYPTCSHYGMAAITTHRSAKGLLLTAWRIMRCNPWARGGIDEVPPRGQWPQLRANATTSQNWQSEDLQSRKIELMNTTELMKQAVSE